MYAPNANWTARKGEREQAPVYYIAIDGLTTKHFSTAPVKSAGTTKKPYLRMPTEIGQTVNPLQGKATLRISDLKLVDTGGEITDLVSTDKSSPTLPTLINRNVTIYEGDVDLVEADYAPVALAQISDVELEEDGVTYTITLVDVKRAQNEDLCTNAEASGLQRYSDFLSAGVALAAKACAVVNVPGVSEGQKLILGPSTHGSYPGGEEKVEVAAVVGTTIFFTSATVKAYNAGDPIRWATAVLQGNPVNLVYALLTGDFDNATFPLEEAVGMPTGLGVPASMIDAADMVKERDRMMPTRSMRFELRQPVQGFRFLEQRFYRFMGYPRIRGDGRFSLRLYRPAWPDDAAAGLPAIAEADVISWRWQRGFDLHVNRVSLGVDFDIETGAAPATVVLEDTTDQADTKEVGGMELEESGLRSSLRGQRLGEVLAAGLLRRYLKSPPVLVLVCGHQKKAIEEGDVAVLTHSRIPNVKTGVRGFTAARMEVVNRIERPEAGVVELHVMDPGYTRPAWIGAAGALPDYDSASAAQREFAHIGQAGTPVGNFGDGTPPYEVI
jgi:hypothetical protein